MFPGKGNSLQCCCMTQLLLLLSFPCVHVYVPVLMGKHHQENDKMRIQALKKAGKEREMKIQKERELLRAKKELEALKIKHQKLSDRVQNYSIFGTYLEDVVKVSQVSVGGSSWPQGRPYMGIKPREDKVHPGKSQHLGKPRDLRWDGKRFPVTRVNQGDQS